MMDWPEEKWLGWVGFGVERMRNCGSEEINT